MRINSKELDAWARALGGPDADVNAALTEKKSRMLAIAAEITQMRQQFMDAGVAEHNQVLDEITKAASGALDASVALGLLRQAFELHERRAAR